MNYSNAIVLGAALVCGVVLTLAAASPRSEPAPTGPYQGVRAGDDRMFVVDTRTGRVAACVGSAPAPSCSRWSSPPGP